ncbi:MAG: thioredoxin domain-containing protein [Nitrospirae bacterium]|nr:thioredoxin domain-containing protein [Candidatus Manganitrophaceae bacterium]
MEQPKHTNRLIHETSPYLLQHAHNPVDWYAWGEEALEKAKAENKPILLSIGYSACHWCHVMAHESFEDEETAQVMNEQFVNIKVDREERPDLDQIYQNAVQLFIRRGGGWPLTMFLTPEKVPFYGGTYFPPEDRYGLPGFPKLLEIVSNTYREKQDEILKTAGEVQQTLSATSGGEAAASGKEIDRHLLQGAAESLGQIFDTRHGGFGGSPKFPNTPAYHLFLRRYQESGEESYRTMVTYTLGKMAWGGIYDQLGGGFHRYSTDDRWLVPHFEKMLYDNAQLARLYFATYQATGQAFYRQIGEEILQYVLREMTDPNGAFYSTQDADSEGEEGKFFVWTPQEIQAIVGEEIGTVLCRHFGVTPAGNFEGKSILHISQPIDPLAKEIGKTTEELEQMVADAKKKLFVEREKRPKPFRDEKILTSWNGLMIGALVQGYNVTRNERYLVAAAKAADFIWNRLYQDGRLLRTFKDGIAKLNGYLDDYAFFIDASLDLYEATGNLVYLDRAERLIGRLIDQFWDDAAGGFFFTSTDHESLIARYKSATDQSIPSGNAVAAQALLRLFHITGDRSYHEKGEKTIRLFAASMEENVFATGSMIGAADFYLRQPKEIVVIGPANDGETERLISNLAQLYLPNKVLFRVDPNQPEGTPLPDPVKGKKMLNNKPTVYLCHQFTCSPPLTEWKVIREQLVARESHEHGGS